MAPLNVTPGPEVIKLFSCSTQLRMLNSVENEFALLINFTLLTIAMFLLLDIVEHENFFAEKCELLLAVFMFLADKI